MYELTNPWVLLLWLLPFGIYYLCKPLHVEHKLALRVPFFAAYQHQQQQGGAEHHIQWLWHWVGIWFLLVKGLCSINEQRLITVKKIQRPLPLPPAVRASRKFPR